MSDQNPATGTARIFGGRYELIEKIGQGRMTEVFRGVDTATNTNVAIKILDQEIAEDTAFAERFVQEAQNFVAEAESGGDTRHPNIVQVLDAGVDDGTYWVAMELVGGSTLALELEEKGKLPVERSLEITESVCRALAFAHSHGIIHRDVTTQNILIDPEGVVKLMDVGVARPTAATTASQTAVMLGSATYVSPEIARGGEPFARSDIYSLGIVLYEMLTGKPPFVGQSPVAVAMQHVRETPKKPSEVNPDISPALETVIMKALAKNPADRYTSADDLRKDLEKVSGSNKTVVGEGTSQVTRIGAGAETMMFTSPGVEHERRVDPKIVIAIALAAALVFGLAFFLLGRTTQVEVPNLIGQNKTIATNALTGAGLKVIILTQVDTHPADTVINQAPTVGSKVPEGSTVTLTVSVAATDAVVPDLAGLSRAAAEQQLSSASLSLGTITTQPSATVQAGSVISQDPAPDTGVQFGSPVNLVISDGIQPVTLPDISCVQIDLAASQLSELGLQMTIAGVETNPLCPATPARVARQEPLPGSTTNSGTTVNVWTTLPVDSVSPVPSGTPIPGAPVPPAPVTSAPPTPAP